MSNTKALTCVDVSRQAWDDEKVTLRSDDTVVIIHLKNPAEHGQFEKDVEYSIALGEDVVAKPSKKKKSARNTAKKTAKKTATKSAATTSETSSS